MHESLTVLYVEDDAAVRRGSKQALELAGLAVEAFESAEQVLKHIELGAPVVLVTDVRLPHMDGIELLRHVHAVDPALPVILVTGHGDVGMAVDAMRAGAYEFIEKPFASERLCDVVTRALDLRALSLEVGGLQRLLDARRGTQASIVGRSPAIDLLRRQIAQLADTDTDVLIQGETGTGKELVARALHEQGVRSKGNYVALNCGGLPESLFEAELFGHETGAFTSASRKRIGKLEHAGRGTLFLDEIETMPLTLQIKLLRVLEERQFERLGSNEALPLDARVVAASKPDLRSMSLAGQFRSDLYFRLSVVILHVPPLRERPEDIPLLFEHFVAQASTKYAREPVPLQRSAWNRLMTHSWPGNVRELRNVAHRWVLGMSEASDEAMLADGTRPRNFEEQMSAFERHLLEDSLRSTEGRASAASELLGLPRKTLYDKLRKHNLVPDQFR
ncbi:MAG: sigma-54-dependent Fis family transcriptional regulator [Rhizobacter sp.]|nr:sigma-54-dependent Fis family transcriptional regulator [Rhizobacter sp.]